MSKHLDEDALGELQTIMGDEFATLVKTFTEDSAARVLDIQKTAALADADALRRAAHSFKGSAGNMGAQRLSELCQQIEDFAHKGQLDLCSALIAELCEEFNQVKQSFSRFLV